MFSVIVPIYKVEPYLRKCLDSVLAQTYTDFEMLLVDDGSLDGCPAICDEYARQDPRVRVIHKPHGGLVSARNVGILAAKGDYICYVDGDDWAHPDMLQFVHDTLEASPVPLDMVLFGAYNVFEDHLGATLNNVPEGYYNRERLEKEVFPRLIVDARKGLNAGCILAHTWDKACRRELQLECYTREERIEIFTDLPMTFECLLKCQNVYICNKQLYYYNKTNEDSIRAKSQENLLTKSFYYLITYMREHMIDLAPSVDQQINQFAASLIIRTAKGWVRKDGSLWEAVNHLKEGLRESGMLSLVSARDLPKKPRLVITLLKCGLHLPAMVLCAAKVRRESQN